MAEKMSSIEYQCTCGKWNVLTEAQARAGEGHCSNCPRVQKFHLAEHQVVTLTPQPARQR